MLILYFKVIMKNAHFAGTVQMYDCASFFQKNGFNNKIKGRKCLSRQCLESTPETEERGNYLCDVCSSDKVIDEGKRDTGHVIAITKKKCCYWLMGYCDTVVTCVIVNTGEC